MQGKGTTISTFNQFFGPVCTEKFRQQVEEMEVDKYCPTSRPFRVKLRKIA